MKQETANAKIETHRLILRNFTERDAQGLLEYSAHPRVNCFLDDRISTLEEAAVNVQKEAEMTLILQFV